MITIDIDTGGTFTDGYIVNGDQEIMVKVDTTPHDYTLCFFNCIERGAKQMNIPTADLLDRTRIIRFSSTIATNAAVQLNGPKMGLIVTAGHEESVYLPTENASIKQFVPENMIVGIDEKTDETGKVLQSPSAEELDEKIRYLLENGARMIVIALKNSHINAENEIAVRGLINKAYPRHYLGAVPMLTSHQVARIPNDSLRTNTAVINAYFHRILVHSLYKAEDLVRDAGYRFPLMIATADFSVTRVAKTRAITTYQSGPASGVRGAHVLGENRKHDHVLCIDVGGTTSDVSFHSRGGAISVGYFPINGVSVAQRIPEIVSFGVGGGSKIRHRDGDITVGPDSQGAVPGPACFGLGGRMVTPTDVWLSLGFLDPTTYLDGRKKIDLSKSESVLYKELGQHLAISAIDAASRAKTSIEKSLAKQILEDGLIPKGVDLSKTVLYSVGGGAGLLAAGLAKELGLGKVYVPSMAAVFSAYGASTLDVSHSYEQIVASEANASGKDNLPGLIDNLRKQAVRDMRGEGYAEEDITYSVEAERFSETKQTDALAALPMNGVVPPALQDFVDSNSNKSAFTVVRLNAVCVTPHSPLQGSVGRKNSAAEALVNAREIYLGGKKFNAPVYQFDNLPLDTVLVGPAIVENAHTSILVPEDVRFALDETGGAVMENN